MNAALPNRLKFAAVASLASSCILVATAFVFGSKVAVEIAAFANWSLFIATSYFTVLPLPKWGTFSSVARDKLKVWLLVFLTFTIASWTAVALVKE